MTLGNKRLIKVYYSFNCFEKINQSNTKILDSNKLEISIIIASFHILRANFFMS